MVKIVNFVMYFYYDFKEKPTKMDNFAILNILIFKLSRNLMYSFLG